MKIAVTILIILALAVVGLLVAIFWQQPPGSGGNSFTEPYETPQPPPEPVMEQTPGPADTAPGEMPVSADGNSTAPETGPGSVSTPVGSQDTAPAPTENPDGSPEPSPSPVRQETDEELNDRRSIMLMQAEELYLAGKYSEALALLRKDETLFNEDTARLESEVIAAMG